VKALEKKFRERRSEQEERSYSWNKSREGETARSTRGVGLIKKDMEREGEKSERKTFLHLSYRPTVRREKGVRKSTSTDRTVSILEGGENPLKRNNLKIIHRKAILFSPRAVSGNSTSSKWTRGSCNKEVAQKSKERNSQSWELE